MPTTPNNIEWTSFKQDLNTCSSLSWETEELGKQSPFLDLNIWINKNTQKIQYSTCQKDMNLFLYIPPHSAHPQNTIKSLIYGLLKTYQRQNPDPNDFQNMSILLFKRLQARGHQHHNLKQIFSATLQKLKSQHNTSAPHHSHHSQKTHTPEKCNHNNSLFFHLQYHPKGISRRTIQQTYHNCCNSTSDNTSDTPDTTFENSSLLSSNSNSNTSNFESLPNQETCGVMTIDNLTVAY